MNDVAQVEAAINENTKLIWVETPTNPMMNVVDIASIASLAKKRQLLLAVDNTFASPYLQQPQLRRRYRHAFCDKISAGHSDVVLGAIVVNSDDLYQRLAFIQCKWCCTWTHG